MTNRHYVEEAANMARRSRITGNILHYPLYNIDYVVFKVSKAFYTVTLRSEHDLY